jgi:hypothetical protein
MNGNDPHDRSIASEQDTPALTVDAEVAQKPPLSDS